uniref:F-box domain-containing protein n=1 Tax=Lactuca sativa TaxID=4236 RepID=A0A9R1UE91_LACSA|nr:hypothetical protein LSAT_V11C900457820 [Lactuca sativa]
MDGGPSMAKRPCCSDPSVAKTQSTMLSESDNDAVLKSFLGVFDYDTINTSYDNLIESRSSDSDENDLIQRALHLDSLLLEAGKRSDRKRSSSHKVAVWPLPPDLTIKVFGMLDTQSDCYAAATCSFFQKQGKESPILTRSCWSSLSANGGALGARLRRLHLYNMERIDNTALLASLSACPSLLDLEMDNYDYHLFTCRDDDLKYPTCNEFVRSCPSITALSLKGFKLHDYKARASQIEICGLVNVLLMHRNLGAKLPMVVETIWRS